MRGSLKHPSLLYQHALPTHKVGLRSKQTSQVLTHFDSLQNVSVLFPKAIHASLNPIVIQKVAMFPLTNMAFAQTTLSAVSLSGISHRLPNMMLHELNYQQKSLFRYLTKFRYNANRILNIYNNISKSHPFLCAMFTAGCVLTLSDVIAQKGTMHVMQSQGINSSMIEYDYRRTLALFTFGFFYYGIIGKGLYLLYDKILGNGRYMFKAMFDSTCHTMILLIPSFYMITGTVKGQPLEECWNQLKREYKGACGFSVLYWVPLMFLTFRFCSQETRILAVTGFSLIHKTALSWFSNRDRVICVSTNSNVPSVIVNDTILMNENNINNMQMTQMIQIDTENTQIQTLTEFAMQPIEVRDENDIEIEVACINNSNENKIDSNSKETETIEKIKSRLNNLASKHYYQLLGSNLETFEISLIL